MTCCHERASDTDDSQEEDKNAEKDESKTPVWPDLRKMIHGEGFRSLVAVAILMNTVVIAIETDNKQPPWNRVWPVLENAFLVFFAGEVLLRLCVDQKEFFTDADTIWWNVLDVTIVLCGILDLWVMRAIVGAEHGTKFGKVMLVMRVVRIFRILRLLRIVRQFRELQELTKGLIGSVRVVVWIMVLFILIIFVCGIVCTITIGHASAMYGENEEEIQRYFGTTVKSMVTLFQFVTLDDWATPARMAAWEQPWLWAFFVVYIFVTSFTILSLMTGVISDYIMTNSGDNEDDEKQRFQDEINGFRERLKTLFVKAGLKPVLMPKKEEEEDVPEKWDDLQTQVEMSVFNNVLENREAVEAFNLHGIEVANRDKQPDGLFKILDVSGTQKLSWRQVFDAFTQMRGQAQSKDLLKVRAMVIKLSRYLALAYGDAPEDHHAVYGIGRKIQLLSDKVQSLSKKLQQMEDNVEALEEQCWQNRSNGSTLTELTDSRASPRN